MSTMVRKYSKGVKAGPRGVEQDIFVEPSTGNQYPVNACPYHRVDLVWNHKNLWVNMQQQAARAACAASGTQPAGSPVAV